MPVRFPLGLHHQSFKTGPFSVGNFVPQRLPRCCSSWLPRGLLSRSAALLPSERLGPSIIFDGLQHRRKSYRRSSIHGERLLLEPQTAFCKPLNEPWRVLKIKVVRPRRRAAPRLDEVLPK